MDEATPPDTPRGSTLGSRSSTHGMACLPGSVLRTGSDIHYQEEAPAHGVSVDGFWLNAAPVADMQFGRFVNGSGHVILAEIPPPCGNPGGAHAP